MKFNTEVETKTRLFEAGLPYVIKLILSVYQWRAAHHKMGEIVECIHSLIFNLRGRVGRNQSPVMWLLWLWHTASWASSWG